MSPRSVRCAKKLKQFSPKAALVKINFLTKKASLCKSTFLSFDSENKILILNISRKRKITFLNFTWYTHFAFASNFTFESNFATSNARHMPFARRTTSARHLPFARHALNRKSIYAKNDMSEISKSAPLFSWINYS